MGAAPPVCGVLTEGRTGITVAGAPGISGPSPAANLGPVQREGGHPREWGPQRGGAWSQERARTRLPGLSRTQIPLCVSGGRDMLCSALEPCEEARGQPRVSSRCPQGVVPPSNGGGTLWSEKWEQYSTSVAFCKASVR